MPGIAAVFLLAAALQPSVNPPAPRFAKSLAEQVRCLRDPQPAPVLMEMVRFGYIRFKRDRWEDQVSCFRVRRSLSVIAADGATAIPVKWICASEGRKKRQSKILPDSPGAGLGPLIVFFVDATTPQATKWVRANRSAKPAKVETSSIFEKIVGGRHWVTIECVPISL